MFVRFGIPTSRKCNGNSNLKVLKYGTETITVTYWTQKGKKFIYEFLKELGIVPLNERKSA